MSGNLFDQGKLAMARADLAAAAVLFQRCVDADPGNAEAWYHLGMAILPRDFDRARKAFDRLLELSPLHHGGLYWRAETDWYAGRPGEAARFLVKLNELAPGHPQNLSRLGLALLAAGDAAGARRALLSAVQCGRGVAEADINPQELRRAAYLRLLGDDQAAAALIRRVNGSGLNEDVISGRHYPIHPERQRCNLEKAVGGRDVVILGSGPSLAGLPDLLRMLPAEQLDRLCFFGFNNVPVADKMLRDTIGRGVDLACMTSAAVISLHQCWIEEYLSRPSGAGLFLTLTASLPDDRVVASMLAARPDRTFYFTASGDYPPIPADPLHFPPINTLMCVLPLAVLARSRHIFLFGCDGALMTHSSDDAFYFSQNSKEYGAQSLPDSMLYSNWLARDTFFFNALIPTVLESLCVLHRISAPPVFICNPQSAYAHFPRIEGGEFLRRVSLEFNPEVARLGIDVWQQQRQITALEKRLGEVESSWSCARILNKAKAKILALRIFAGRIHRYGLRKLRAWSGKA